MSKTCIKCGSKDIYCKDMCIICYKYQYYLRNAEKQKARKNKRRRENPQKFIDINNKSRRKAGHLSMYENHTCTLFLGVHVAERVLSNVFNNVVRQPNNTPGFDFICNKGKKIDVKSSCMHFSIKQNPSWQFQIKKNQIADYFLCLAFDNRTDLNPIHMWLIPASCVNNQYLISATTDTISKWDKYALNIDKVSACCNVLRLEK